MEDGCRVPALKPPRQRPAQGAACPHQRYRHVTVTSTYEHAAAGETAAVLRSTRLPASPYAAKRRRHSVRQVLRSFHTWPSLTASHSAPAKPQPEAGDPNRPPHIPLPSLYLALQLEGAGALVVLPVSELLLQPQQLLLQLQLLLLQMRHGGHHLLDHREGPGCRQAGAFPTAEPPSCSGSKDRAGQDPAASPGKGMPAMRRISRGCGGDGAVGSSTGRSPPESSDVPGAASQAPRCRPG